MSVELKCVRKYHANGNLWHEEFRNSDGQLHNAAGPAVRRWYEHGVLACEYYFLNGKCHNASGPAARVWHENGQLEYESYYLDGEWHNAAGPAFRSWYKNGKLACEEYYLNGKFFSTQAEWKARVNPARAGWWRSKCVVLRGLLN
jgi:antitoxin component YwqK of YwqJK toxin-antitoxin module